MARAPSLIRVFAVRIKKKLGSLAIHWAHSEDSDQTGRVSRMICVFAGRKCQYAGFVTRRLISFWWGNHIFRIRPQINLILKLWYVAKFTPSIVIVRNLMMNNMFNVWLVRILLNIPIVPLTQKLLCFLWRVNKHSKFAYAYEQTMCTYIRFGELLNFLSEVWFPDVCVPGGPGTAK